MDRKHLIGHFIFWLTILVLGTATIYPYYMDVRIAFIDRIIFLPVWLIATYLNWLYLMPKYLSEKKLTLYITFVILLILFLTVVQRYLALYLFYPLYLWDTPQAGIQEPFLVGKFIQFGAFIALPVGSSVIIYLLMKWYKESYQARQILAQQQTAELSYLKAQINPHFLFNTLNNLYGLSLEQSQKVPDLILKLSDILSYSLYESSTEKIALYKEIKLIKDFIALEKERYEGRMLVDFHIDENLNHAREIAPLLLIPLVENAYKHGVKEATEEIPIVISLDQQGNELCFQVKNKVPDLIPPANPQRQGLGLSNLKRRLNLLYPQKHTLDTRQEDETFTATLKLQIDE